MLWIGVPTILEKVISVLERTITARRPTRNDRTWSEVFCCVTVSVAEQLPSVASHEKRTGIPIATTIAQPMTPISLPVGTGRQILDVPVPLQQMAG
jgi:hypothetical protein